MKEVSSAGAGASERAAPAAEGHAVGARCVVCGGSMLSPHLRVVSDAKETLVATTTRYGSAPADIIRCVVCGHMQIAEFPDEETLDDAYAEVSEAAYLDQEEGQRATANRALERISRHRDGGALCDLGCWVGFLLSEAERQGWEAWGVEPSRFAAEFARDRFGLHVLTGTLSAEELPEGHFDAVVMGDVIEHVPAPGVALDRITRLLKPRGVVYLTLPDAGSAAARALGRRWWSVIPTHVQYFTRRSMALLLANHGYAVEWMGTAPKAFTMRYYAERIEGYSPQLASGAVRILERAGGADRLIWPDLRDRMAIVARMRER